MNADGGRAVGVAQDIRTFEGASRLVERAVEVFGRVDVLVNCAGVTVTDGVAAKEPTQPQGAMPLYGGTLLDLSEDTWNFVIAAELTSVLNCTRAAAC